MAPNVTAHMPAYPRSGLVAGVLDRPASTPLTVAIVFVAIGAALHWAIAWYTRPKHPVAGPAVRPPATDLAGRRGTESAAVVGLLTSDYEPPRAAITATAIDLASRGWIRLAHSDGELMVVTKGAPASGDTLRPHEQLVLNHLTSRAFNDVVSGITLAASQRRLGYRWRSRFDRALARTSSELALTRRRYPFVYIAPTAIAAAIALYAVWRSIRGGTEVAVADSWLARSLWFAVLGAIAWLAWRTFERALGTAQVPTELGAERAGLWLGYRARLAERIPSHASVVGTPAQQDALARAFAMGLSRQAGTELPLIREDPRRAWSEAGGKPHVVRVRYPVRPAYGQHPLKVLVGGLVVLLIAVWLRRYFGQVADGEALTGLLDKSPGQLDLLHGIARTLSVLCWIPIVAALWAVLAGTIDTLVSRSRTGEVVRARQPHEVLPRFVVSVVKPFGERSGFSTYLGVDDGRRHSVYAWLATERSAAPQGAQARVVATPLLGYVRASEPIGSSTRA